MKMVKIKATDEQMKQMAAKAINASAPIGMGFYHFKHGNDRVTAEDVPIYDNAVYCDYVEGRMVKFHAWKKGGYWEVRENLDPEYQSWCVTYPTWSALVSAVGAEVIE